MKKKTAIIPFIILLLCACHPTTKLTQKQRYRQKNEIILFAKKLLHTPYRYGGNTPKGFDCSGYTRYVYQQFDYPLHRTARQQAKQLKTVTQKDAQIGDLVFFGGYKQLKKINHVGIITKIYANNSFDFIHASTSQGVIISNIQEKYYARRYLKVGRVNMKTNIHKNKIKRHIVEPKETLYSISKKYGCTIKQIKKWNRLKNNLIQIGQTLTIHTAQKK